MSNVKVYTRDTKNKWRNKIYDWFYPEFDLRWYHKYFRDPRYMGVRYSYPFKRLFYRVWFYIPRKIRDYNESECEHMVPDWMSGHGTKVKPLFGYVFIKPEGEQWSLNWFKYIKKYKVSIEALRIQTEIDLHNK